MKNACAGKHHVGGTVVSHARQTPKSIAYRSRVSDYSGESLPPGRGGGLRCDARARAW